MENEILWMIVFFKMIIAFALVCLVGWFIETKCPKLKEKIVNLLKEDE